MPSGFTFDGKHSSSIAGLEVVVNYGKDILPAFENKLVSVDGRDGVLDYGYTLKERVIPVSFWLKGVDIQDYFKKAEEVARWLNTKVVRPFQLDNYTGRTFQARLLNGVDPERFARRGMAELEFLVPEVTADGALIKHAITHGTMYDYEGNYKAKPKITVTAKSNLTHLRIDKGNPENTKANFEGKVSGSVVENPHIFKRTSVVTTSLLAPNAFTFEDSMYSDLTKLDGTLRTSGRVGAGHIEQHSASFNLVEHVKRLKGFTPSVQWLKDNIHRLVVRWYGKGSGPNGNKLSLSMWREDQAAWYTPVQSHTSGTVTPLALQTYFSNIFIDSKGFFHASAYADASDGTTQSMVETDYIELEVMLKGLTGKFILVNRNFSTNDIIVIDTKARKLTVNGVDIRNDLDAYSSWQGMAIEEDYAFFFSHTSSASLTAEIEYIEKWV